MNYYRRYVGDYQRDTMHLSLVEHGVYAVLLDAYYARDGNLQSDIGDLIRTCRAFSKAEQAAVGRIAEEFFPVNGTGKRHNKRADAELSIALKAIETMKKSGIIGAKRRWGKR